MNYSRQRQIITKTLQQNVVHPTAEYLYNILKKDEPKLSLATLYRNLNQLADAGMIKKIEGLDGCAHFDHNIHEHYHFICNKCGKVFDVSSQVAPNLVQKTENQTGFKIENCDIIFQGICKDCR
jgi:Fur family peroxide stress response transcriptional regulator